MPTKTSSKKPITKTPVKSPAGRAEKVKAPQLSSKSKAVAEAEADLHRILAEPGDLTPEQLDRPYSLTLRGSDLLEINTFMTMGIDAYLKLPISDEEKIAVIEQAKKRATWHNIYLNLAKREV